MVQTSLRISRKLLKRASSLWRLVLHFRAKQTNIVEQQYKMRETELVIIQLRVLQIMLKLEIL